MGYPPLPGPLAALGHRLPRWAGRLLAHGAVRAFTRAAPGQAALGRFAAIASGQFVGPLVAYPAGPVVCHLAWAALSTWAVSAGAARLGRAGADWAA